MVGKDLIMATLFGSGGGSSGSGGGIPQEDIDAAFASLAEKGVTVPDGATSADLDELIASIVQSGGNTIFGRTFETGTFVSASESKSLQIIHSLGEVPTGMIYWTEADAFADATRTYDLLGVAIFYETENWYGVRSQAYKSSATTTSSVSYSGRYKSPSGKTNNTYSPTGSQSGSAGLVYNMATVDRVYVQGAVNLPAGVEYKYILFGGLPQ